MRLNQVMRGNCKEKEEYFTFIAKLFDPYESGFVKAIQFESLVNALFEGEMNEGQESQ